MVVTPPTKPQFLSLEKKLKSKSSLVDWKERFLLAPRDSVSAIGVYICIVAEFCYFHPNLLTRVYLVYY